MSRLLILLLCLFPSFSAIADTMIQIDADAQYQFADTYYAKGDYFKAAAEYERFIHFFPDDPRVSKAMFFAGMSHYKGGRFPEAIRAFQATADSHQNRDWAVKSHLMISESYMNLKEPGMAVLTLNNLMLMTDDAKIKDEARYRIGWIYIETGAWETAKEQFGTISSENQSTYKIENLYSAMEAVKSLPRKNPTLAGMLSVVPGAGFLYCERYQDAFTAFLLNGGLMAAAIEAFNKEHYALGGVISFVGFGFYAGNIYGAVSSAHKYNRTAVSNFIEDLKRRTRIGLIADPDHRGVALSGTIPFD